MSNSKPCHAHQLPIYEQMLFTWIGSYSNVVPSLVIYVGSFHELVWFQWASDATIRSNMQNLPVVVGPAVGT